MFKCDYCCSRPSSLEIVCLKCSPSRSINICFKCSLNVNQLREHAKQHPLSTYKLTDIPLDCNIMSEWLCTDEINLIEIIESCGLGNWIDIGLKMSKNSLDCQNHFEDIYLSRLTNPYYIYFQSFKNSKKLIGEDLINDKDYKNQSLIYPPLLIDNDKQKLLTYMPQRDEYEREYLNEAENRLPILNNDDQQLNDQQEQDGSRILLNKAKLALLRSYKQVIQRRLQLKHFIRDYALPFNYLPDQQMELHQISRFLSADEYERLIFNHKRIQSLLEELGCSTSSNGHNDQSQSRKRSPILNNEKRRRRPPLVKSNNIKQEKNMKLFFHRSIVVDESSSCSSTNSSLSSNENSSNLSISSSNPSDELILKRNSNIKRRSVRRVSSSSSTNTSSKTTNIKEPLYTRRRVNQTDNQSMTQRTTRSTGNILTTSDISWDSTDDEVNQLSNSNYHDQQSTVASRTRSHTPPQHSHERKHMRNSPNNKKFNNHTNGLTKFDPSDQSTPKMNRMLTRHQLVVQQTSPNKKRKLNSNSNDEEFIDI
ncbi:unnamed protein product [Adineta steineri]|uniref:Transcriptional adapter 2-alpha/beta-like domain-containing protein n=2 Tax=Adineta steineri TaxID=433720 RepID=A0A815L291_9BILA|nr:unnamed protein product [Adineta steineri]CAF1403328.1 unnamed protein product [Adineta steineri]